jgi:succinylarginine dihydrolase
LESEGGNGTVVAIRPDERAWLDSIRTLAAEWLAAVEAADRSWIAQAATRIQRYDNQSDGLIDLMVAWPPGRQCQPE